MTESHPGGDERPPRRRAGRWRRWLVRPLGWLLALIAVLLLLASLIVDSAPFERAMIARTTEWLEERLGRQVEIGSLDVDLTALEVVARDLVLAGDGTGSEPVLRVARLRVLAAVELGRPLAIGLRLIEIDQPELRLELTAEGGSNLPSWSRAQSAEEPRQTEVEVGSVVVRDATVLFADRRVDLSFATRELAARVVGGDDDVRVHLVTRDLELMLPAARPYLGTLVARGAVAAGRVELLSARLGGPDLSARAAGVYSWQGEDRRLDLTATARGETALLDRLGYSDGSLLSGPFLWDGGFTWSPEEWGFRGDLTSPRLVLDGRPLEAVEGVLSGDAAGILLDLSRADYARGRVSGTVRVGLGSDELPAEVDLVFDRLDLLALAADQGIDLPGVAGRLNGVFNYRFSARDATAGTGWGEVGVSSRGRFRDRLGLTGTVPLVVQNGVVSTRAVRLTTEGQRITAAGRYDLATGRGAFDYRVASERIELLRPLLAIDPEEPPLPWVPTSGSGTISGTLHIAPTRVWTTLNLDLTAVEAPGARADRLTGAMTVDALGVEALRMELARPERALMVVGSLPFEMPRDAAAADASPPFDLTIDAVAWPLAETAPWLPFELPLDGDLSGTLVVGGDLEAPSGQLRAEVAPVTLAGVSWRLGTARLRFDPSVAVLEEVTVEDEAGTIRLSGTVPFADAELDLAFESSALDLTRPPARGLLPQELGGWMEVGGAIGGTLEAPEIVVHLDGRDLSLAERPLGDGGRTAMVAFWDGSEVAIDGSFVGLLGFVGGGRLDVSGVDVEIAVNAYDVGALARLVAPDDLALGDLRGELGGRLLLRSDLDDPASADARLELDRVRVSRGEHTFESLEPVMLRWEGSAVEIESIYLADPDGIDEIFVAGRIGLEDDLLLDLRVQSRLSSDWLELFMPTVSLDGEIDLLAGIRGTAAKPAVDGQAELSGGRAILEDFPQALEELTATVLFYPEQVVLDSARARVGQGALRFGGSLALWSDSPAGIDYRFQISATGLRLRYPEGWLIEGGGEIEVASTDDGRQVRGVVTLDEALYYQDIDVGVTTLLQGFFERQRFEVGSTDELLTTTQLNIAVEGGEALAVRNNLADFAGSLDLTIRGNAASPVLFGRVELAEGGTLVYAGTNYRVERMLLTFVNPYRIEPLLDMVATTRIDQYDVTLNLSGTLDRLNATFASDPPLADLEILGLVATGRVARGPVEGGSGQPGAMAAEGFLYGQAADLISRRVNTLFGLDRFRIDPLTGSSGGPSSARVTIGKRLSRDLVATYSYDPSTTEQQILQVEWQVSPTFALIVTQNGDGSYAVDGRWERRF